MKIFIKFFRILLRYLIASNNLGILNTLKIIKLKFNSTNVENIFKTKKFGKIHWRNKLDTGVISHFYSKQININTYGEKPKLILDIGANIGIETLRFNYLYPDSKIISLEPERNNYNLLKKNTTGKKNIIPVNKALWNTIDTLSVENYSNLNSQTFRVNKKNNEKDIISRTTLKSLILEYEINQIDILKIDVEGSEAQIFDGNAIEWLENVKVIILECPDNDAPFTSMKIYKSLLKCNLKFKTYINGENFVFISEICNWRPEYITLY